MKNKAYIRMTCYHRPALETTAAHLADLALTAEPAGVLEGFLSRDILVGAPLCIHQLFHDGLAATADFISKPVAQIENCYVLTADALFQVLRVPSPEPPSRVAKPANDVPRTTVSSREYLALQNDVYTLMAEVAPDLAMAASLFALHAERFAQLRRDMPDERTGMPFSIVDLAAEFSALQDALCFRYSYAENRDKRQREIWIAGHQCLHALRLAVLHETAFLAEGGHLTLFTSCQVRLMRLLRAWKHFTTHVPESETAYGEN